MVRVWHPRNTEIRHTDCFATQNEIDFEARVTGGVGGLCLGVRIVQTRCFHEQVEFVRAPEGVEISRNDNRLFTIG